MTFLTILAVTEICSFRLVLEGKTDKEIPKSSRLEFIEKFLANNFALSEAEDDTFRPLNRGGIADLPLLRTLLAIPMEHLSNDHEDHPNQHANSHKLCDETGHPVSFLFESQWNLRQQNDQNFPVESHCRTNTSVRRKK